MNGRRQAFQRLKVFDARRGFGVPMNLVGFGRSLADEL
jgi:hypothetical protein